MSGTYFRSGALIESTTTTVTSGGVTTLTASSATNQQFTGTAVQTVQLPNATTLQIGRKFRVLNRSSSPVTVKYNDGTTTAAELQADTQADFIVISASSSNGTWDVAVSIGSVASGSESALILQAYCFADSTGTPVGCSDPTVVSGKTRVTINNNYPLNVTPGFANGALRVLINGQKIPRYVDATLTPDASYTEVDDVTVDLDRDYSAFAYSIEIYQEMAVVDTNTQNTTDLVSIKGSKLMNLVINGNFDFWQRFGTDAITFADTVPSLEYGPDRWLTAVDIAAGFNFSVGGSTDVPTVAESGFKSTWSFLCTALAANTPGAAEYIAPFIYQVEGYDFAAVHQQQVTLSFWAKSSTTGTYSVAFQNAALNRSYVTTFTIDAINTWEFKSIVISLDTGGTWLLDNSLGIKISINAYGGSSLRTASLDTWQAGNYVTASTATNLYSTNGHTMRIAQVAFTGGTGFSANEFIRAGSSITDELLKCQRYFVKTYEVDTPLGTVTNANELAVRALGTAQGSATMQWFFPVFMRTAPTLLVYSPGTGTSGKMRDLSTSVDVNASSVATAGTNQVSIQNTAATINGSTYGVHSTADAEF